MRRRVLILGCLAVAAILFGIADKYILHTLPLKRNPIGQWAAAHYLVDAGRPDIAARRLQEDMQRTARLQQKSAVWRSVLLAGMGEACFALSTAYKDGASKQPALAGQFFAYVHEYGNCGKRYAIELGQLLQDRGAWLGESHVVELETNPPVIVTDLHGIAAGRLPDRTAALKLYSHRLQEGVSAVLHRMSPDGGREVNTQVFLATMGASLESMAQLVGEPKRQELLKVASSLRGQAAN